MLRIIALLYYAIFFYLFNVDTNQNLFESMVSRYSKNRYMTGNRDLISEKNIEGTTLNGYHRATPINRCFNNDLVLYNSETENDADSTESAF